jgi:hypothetical protein
MMREGFYNILFGLSTDGGGVVGRMVTMVTMEISNGRG